VRWRGTFAPASNKFARIIAFVAPDELENAIPHARLFVISHMLLDFAHHYYAELL
jgi:hypothetical protein